MEITFADRARGDLEWWKASGNTKAMAKITALLQSIKHTPFDGIGKPEPLKHSLSGTWSRRINSSHRIVYEVYAESVQIISLKGHYD